MASAPRKCSGQHHPRVRLHPERGWCEECFFRRRVDPTPPDSLASPYPKGGRLLCTRIAGPHRVLRLFLAGVTEGAQVPVSLRHWPICTNRWVRCGHIWRRSSVDAVESFAVSEVSVQEPDLRESRRQFGSSGEQLP